MKGQDDHYTCSCVVDELVNYNHTVNEVRGNEAVVNMYDLAVKEVVGISAVVNSMAVSGVVDTMAVSVVMDALMVDGAGVDEKMDDATMVSGVVVDEKVKDATMVDGVVVDEKVKDATMVDGVRDRGSHFKVVGLKILPMQETLSSVFCHLSGICAPSYLQPQQI